MLFFKFVSSVLLCQFIYNSVHCRQVNFSQNSDIEILVSELKRNTARLEVLENKVSFIEKDNIFLRSKIAEMTTDKGKNSDQSSTSLEYDGKIGTANPEKKSHDNTQKNNNMIHHLKGKRNFVEPEDTVGSKQMAFTVKTSRNIDPLNNHQTIVFDQVLTNIGAGYNHMTGIFKANVPGVYIFFNNIGGSDHQELWTWIVKDGTRLVDTYTMSHNAAGYHGADSNMVVVHLAEGESVWVETVSDGGHTIAVIQNGSTFSGFLLYPDP